MRVGRLVLVGVFALAPVVFMDGPVAAGGRPLSTTLTGAAEVPGPGDPDGSGTAEVTLNPGRGEVCFDLAVTDIAPATAVHIHEAPVGDFGDVVVTLVAPAAGTSRGCVDADRDLIKAIIRDPSA